MADLFTFTLLVQMYLFNLNLLGFENLTGYLFGKYASKYRQIDDSTDQYILLPVHFS